MLLVAGGLLPVVLFAVVVVYKLSSQEEEASERRVLLAARNLAGAVEREVSSTARTLQALAASEQLDDEDLSSFYNEVQRAAQTQPTWLAVILLSPEGRQLINTRRSLDAPLPPVSEPTSLRRIIETQQPTVGDLALGRLGDNLAFPVRVPVMRDGELKYILTAVITPGALASVVEEQAPIDGEWTRTVVDGEGIVVARTRNPERFVGQRGTPSFLERIGATNEGVYRDTTLEGVKVYVAFKRLSDSRWTAAVTVPVEVIQAPTRRAIWLVVGSGFALLVISGGGALMLSQRISRSFVSASSAAEALAKGERPHIMPSSIREVELLGAALDYSAELLSQRQRQRDQHLAQAEAARAEAEAANRLKDEFLITISHELRTPLNAILGWTILLRTQQLSEDKALSALETIERNAKAQARMVDDLLDTSRIITGKLQFKEQVVNLASVVTNAIASVRQAAEAKSIKLKPQLDEQPVVLGDSDRLQQVVWNLLSNAVKFTPRGGQVEVSLQSVGKQAEIEVRDMGIGIRAEFLPHVFDRFRQSDGSTTREFGGLGLGLAIARHLVELHGGTIHADSPGKEQGAVFTVRLPLLQTEAEEQGDDQSLQLLSCDLQPLQNIRVLLVDDEADTRELIAFILEQAGATLTMANSAIAALELLPQVQPDVLVSDVGMPDMDGYTLIQRIRAMSAAPLSQVPALALTAYAGVVNQQQALAAGFQMHLAKPVEPEALVEAIAALVSRS